MIKVDVSIPTMVTRKRICEALNKEKIYQPWKFFRSWSNTIGKFKELAVKNPTKFETYVRLLNSFLSLAQSQGAKVEFKLYLPSADALLAIDIDSLLREEEPRREIVRRCYRPTEKKINLKHLVGISRQYCPDIKV